MKKRKKPYRELKGIFCHKICICRAFLHFLQYCCGKGGGVVPKGLPTDSFIAFFRLPYLISPRCWLFLFFFFISISYFNFSFLHIALFDITSLLFLFLFFIFHVLTFSSHCRIRYHPAGHSFSCFFIGPR